MQQGWSRFEQLASHFFFICPCKDKRRFGNMKWLENQASRLETTFRFFPPGILHDFFFFFFLKIGLERHRSSSANPNLKGKKGLREDSLLKMKLVDAKTAGMITTKGVGRFSLASRRLTWADCL